jgi:hypothetical protein
MENWFNFENLKTKISSLKTRTRKLFKEAWPINWSNFKKPKLIFDSFLEASYAVKSLFFVAFTGLVISVYFLFLGNYLVFTKEVPTTGGEIREAVIDPDFKLFNPVLALNSEAEKKVARLLFHPLYDVNFPDYLNDSESLPQIKPILLSKSPEWQDLSETSPDNKYKVLRFELKNNLKWSDGTKIDVEDVEYTFNRIKEQRANPQYRDVFSKVEFVRVSENEFDLRSTTTNPQLIYLSNFSPISKNFYDLQSIDKLYTSFNSSKPLVTSGYFTFSKDQTKDPDKAENTLRDNPIREDGNDNFKTVILSRNPFQNSGENVNVDRYIVRRYNTVLDVGGSDNDSLERAAKNRKVDIFTRPLNLNAAISSEDLKAKIGLSQKIVNTNTYYNLYLNIKRNDLFLNSQLRKYLICSLIPYQASKSYFSLENIPANQRLVPIQLGASTDTDCPTNPKDVLDGKNFKLEEDLKTGIKKILTCGRRCTQINKLNVIAFDESDGLVTEIQAYLRDIGMPAEVYKSSEEVQKRLVSKDYSLAFLPITLVSRDLYPIFGSKTRDISQIRLNNQKAILDAKVDDNLYNYSVSDLSDVDSKTRLVDFFSKEYISINLFRSKFETNYSDRVNNLSTSLPDFDHINAQIYLSIPSWYIQTKRQWK